jgi:hypothetical protein
VHPTQCGVDGLGYGHATGEIWNRHAPVAARGLLEENEISNVLHGSLLKFRAWLNTQAIVLRSTSGRVAC